MAITIKHAKTDSITDWTQTELDAQIAAGNFPPGTLLANIVLPSDWNNDHTIAGTVPIANGGTGQTTANAAINALLPSQTSQSGKVLSTDGTNTSWLAVSGSGTVTSVTGTAPVSVATGTTTPVISMAAANTTTNGYLTSTDWNTFNSKGNGTVTSVALSAPSIFNVSGSPITSSGTISLTYSGTALPVLNGGTGVTTSSGANSVVLRDANANITTNCLFEGFTSQAAGTLITLTAASVQNWVISGSGGQTIKLPDATTLPNGALFTFNNNQTSGTIIVQNNSSTTVATLQAGAFITVALLSNSIAAGTWDAHAQAPSNVSWSTNTFDYAGSITSATWNGTAIALNRGGTNANLTAVNGGAVYSTGSALAITAAGTSGQVLTSSGAGAPTWTTPTTGTVTSVTGTSPVVSSGGATPAISMPAATTSVSGYLTSTDWTTFNNKGSGTVTSVAALTLGTTGTDLSSTVATGTTTPVITLQVPTASATNRGALSAADWTTFNNKGSGTVTSASVVSANGFAGTVATATTTPAITISTSITGVLKGNGTAISAATAGTDYSAGTSANTTGLVYSTTTTGALTTATAAQIVAAIGSTAVTNATNLAGGTVGAVHYQSAASTSAFLTGNTTTTPQFVTSTGTGTVAQAPTLTGSTGTGNVVLATSPTLVTPTLGVASATSINKVTVTAPATGSTLTLVDGSTLATSGAFSTTLTATATTNVTLPTTGTLATLAGTETFTNKTLTNPTITNYTETLFTVTGSATLALTNGTIQKVTTSGSTTITLPASATGKSFTVIVSYAAADSITWAGGSTIKWAGGTTPTPTSATGKIDIFNFYQDGTNTYGSIFGQNY
jgi:hypothetical protein